MATLLKGVNIGLIKNLGTVFKSFRNLTVASSGPASSYIAKPLYNNWIWRQNDKIETPLTKNKYFELPNGLVYVPFIDPIEHEKIIEEEPSNDNISKEVAKLIVIRRKKMKKHKLRKLRKRMKFEWAKIRQRREWKKEKDFQAVLIQQCKEAEAFSAEKYVEDKIAELDKIIVPRTWKGRRLPEFIVREKMGLPSK